MVSEDINKTIWILWFQGWADAPWTVQNAKKSWEIHNPDWNIVFLDEKNIYDYLDNIDFIMNRRDVALATKADYIRLALLSKYGGIWTDANVFCLQPLNDWIHMALDTVGVWMYHGYSLKVGVEKGCAVWFIASLKGNELIEKWRIGLAKYWDGRGSDIDYHSLEHIFIKLRKEDPEFEKIWDDVPYVNSEQYGESHCLSMPGDRKLMTDDDKYLKNIFYHNRPFMVKLWGSFETVFPDKESEACKRSNGYFVVMLSHNKIEAPKY
jgi:hypothetical protein